MDEGDKGEAGGEGDSKPGLMFDGGHRQLPRRQTVDRAVATLVQTRRKRHRAFSPNETPPEESESKKSARRATAFAVSSSQKPLLRRKNDPEAHCQVSGNLRSSLPNLDDRQGRAVYITVTVAVAVVVDFARPDVPSRSSETPTRSLTEHDSTHGRPFACFPPLPRSSTKVIRPPNDNNAKTRRYSSCIRSDVCASRIAHLQIIYLFRTDVVIELGGEQSTSNYWWEGRHLIF